MGAAASTASKGRRTFPSRLFRQEPLRVGETQYVHQKSHLLKSFAVPLLGQMNKGTSFQSIAWASVGSAKRN